MVALLKNLVSEPVFIHSSLSEGLRKAVESPLPALAAGLSSCSET